MPQQFLHDFEFRTHASQQRRIRVAKRMPADTFLDSDSLRNRTNILPRCIVILLRRSCGAEGLSGMTTRWDQIGTAESAECIALRRQSPAVGLPKQKCILSKGTASHAQLGYVPSKERMPRNPRPPYFLPTSPCLGSYSGNPVSS